MTPPTLADLFRFIMSLEPEQARLFLESPLKFYSDDGSAGNPLIAYGVGVRRDHAGFVVLDFDRFKNVIWASHWTPEGSKLVKLLGVEYCAGLGDNYGQGS